MLGVLAGSLVTLTQDLNVGFRSLKDAITGMNNAPQVAPIGPIRTSTIKLSRNPTRRPPSKVALAVGELVLILPPYTHMESRKPSAYIW